MGISNKSFRIAEDIMRDMRQTAYAKMTYQQVDCAFDEDHWEFEGYSLMVGVYTDNVDVVYYDDGGAFIDDYETARHELATTIQLIFDDAAEYEVQS